MPGASVIHDLPQTTWRGHELFVSSVRTSWSHRLPERTFLDVPGAAHDWTGREPLKVEITAHFHNTIKPGLYDEWAKVRTELLSAEIGELRHPEIGIFNVRPESVAYQISSSSSTAGIDVEISFVESIVSADQPTEFSETQAGSAKAAKDADVAIEAMGVDYPDGMPSPTFSESLAALESLDFTLSFEIQGAINQMTGLVDSMYEVLQFDCLGQLFSSGATKETLAGHPFRWLLENSLNGIRSALQAKLAAVQAGGADFLVKTTTGDTTLASLSLELGVDVGSLVRLNPTLASKPKIPAGSKVQYLPPN